MQQYLSQRVQSVEPSATLALSAKAAQMQAAGRKVINLTVGEPDFDTPEHIKQAAITAIHEGKTKYTAVDGIKELKTAIINKLSRDNQLTYTPEQIIVSNGAKQSLYNLAQAILNPGDECIIPAPYWVSYPAMVKLAGAKPVIINCGVEQHFKLQPEQLAATINAKTRLVILNGPSNPTGMTYTKDELAALGEVLRKHPHVYIASDDIYEHIIWQNLPFCQILNACPDLTDRTIIVNGVSKAYAMTGWRIGYVAGPAKLVGAMRKIQSHSTSNPCSISQAAAVAALNGDNAELTEMVAAYKKRHDYVHQHLSDLKGFRCLPSDGTFYSFPDIQEYLQTHNRLKTDIEFADYLLNEGEIAVVPGTAFGQPGCFRLSYATSQANLEEAMRRLQKLFA